MVTTDRELSPARAAEILDVHVDTVRAWVVRGVFATARRTLTGRIRIKASEVRAILSDHLQKT
jgi:predicted site-specific integrase-resolvase